MVEFLKELSNLLVHFREPLEEFAHTHPYMVYLLLGGIVFCETGLVITPFLPGDSLLFGCGTLAERGGLNVFVLGFVFIAAALLGDNVNYWLGRALGPRILRGERIPLLNRKNLDRTRKFFARHGGKSVVMARFVPIVRTFAPFTAGIGLMPYSRFLAFSLAGAALWVGVCVSAGWFLGRIPVVDQNFEIVIIAIVFVSLIPVLIGMVRARREAIQERRADTIGDTRARDAA